MIRKGEYPKGEGCMQLAPAKEGLDVESGACKNVVALVMRR